MGNCLKSFKSESDTHVDQNRNTIPPRRDQVRAYSSDVQIESNDLQRIEERIINVRGFSTVPSTYLNGSITSQSSNQNVISINGQLQYNKNKLISTNVYEGISSGRKVAVKIEEPSKVDREILFLSTLDHQNILRLIFDCSVSAGQKLLISEFYELPLTKCSTLDISFKAIMYQLASAVEHLQRKKIMHLDVSPNNIFFVKRDHEYVVKLTNFTKAEQMSNGVAYRRNNISSDKDFSSPELIHGKVLSSTDIWSLGKVFLFIMIKMGHGKKQNNVKRGRNNFVPQVTDTLVPSQLKNDSNESVLCKHVVDKMLTEPLQRIAAEDILKHPFFWTEKATCDFIIEVAKMLEGSNNDFRTEIFKGSQRVIGGRRNAEWTSRISTPLLDELKKARKAYCNRTGANNDDIDGKKISNLVMTIRNMIVHTKTQEVIEIVGSNDEAFIKYWTSRFPNLIVHLYDAKLKYENKEN